MSCKLVNGKNVNMIPMNKLPGGKIGVTMNGTLVQRGSEAGRDSFVILGEVNLLSKATNGQPVSNGFSGVCEMPVRVLEEGELIEVKYTNG